MDILSFDKNLNEIFENLHVNGVLAQINHPIFEEYINKLELNYGDYIIYEGIQQLFIYRGKNDGKYSFISESENKNFNKLPPYTIESIMLRTKELSERFENFLGYYTEHNENENSFFSNGVNLKPGQFSYFYGKDDHFVYRRKKNGNYYVLRLDNTDRLHKVWQSIE
jgi:hypothetical protein